MASYVPPQINQPLVLYVALTSQASRPQLQANPTLAAGDVTVSIDGGAFANLATLPAVTPASGKSVKVQLSAAETNGDNIVLLFSDVAGAEWDDLLIDIQTSARRIDDLAYPETSGRKIIVDASGNAQADVRLWQGNSPLGLSSSRVQVSVAAIQAGIIDSAAFAAGAITAAAIAADAIGASELAADAATEIAAAVWTVGNLTSTTANALADYILRRSLASAEASAYGDALALRSLLGAASKLVNKIAIAAGVLSIYKTDDTTALGTQAVGTDSAADPVVSLDTA